MKTAELKVLPVTVLKPAEYNPRKKLKPGDKEYEKIKASIEEFGFADPLVVNSDMTIIGGHQRLTVAIDLGFTEVPCAVVDIDKTREKALNIALNKITGAWDENLLADLLKDIQDSNFDLGFTGFDPPEIETLFNKVHTKDVAEDDFDVEAELAQPVFSKLGDLWCLGKHRVICGDSTGEEIYTRLMDGQRANLVLTDPPYNVDVEETAGKIMNDNMADEDFYNFLLSAYRCMHANLADLLKNGDERDVKAELLASKIARCFRAESVAYEPSTFEGKPVSRSRIITSEDEGLVSMEAVDVYCVNHELDRDAFVLKKDAYAYHMMNLIDYLVGNTDRHSTRDMFFRRLDTVKNADSAGAL